MNPRGLDMNDLFAGRRVKCLWAIVAGALLITGCDSRSVSGVYVSHTDNQAALLQITETPDHRFTGTLRHTTLNNDGTLSSGDANVSGSVDGGSITLTVLAAILPIGKNFSGAVTRDGIDLNFANGNQTAVQHFARGRPSDFESAVAQLNQIGQPIVAARRHGQQVDQLNRQVGVLASDINRFVASADQHIKRLSKAKAYYERAVIVEQAKLTQAQRLKASGNSIAQGQAAMIVAQMGGDKSQLSMADDGLDRTHNDAISTENSLNARISAWRGTCLDGGAVKRGDAIPDMGPCKALSQAVASYNATVPVLHDAFSTAQNARTQSNARLALIWRSADQME
ncbi:hypothetical protein AT395_17810 [Pandoraea apista]|nr:hypothetical protein AT395_17810 [Pandoraea apista]